MTGVPEDGDTDALLGDGFEGDGAEALDRAEKGEAGEQDTPRTRAKAPTGMCACFSIEFFRPVRRSWAPRTSRAAARPLRWS